MTTRMIGALIMVHGDDSGLKLPPRIAPVQAVIIPIQQRKEGVLEKAAELEAALKAAGIRVKTDATDKSPVFRFVSSVDQRTSRQIRQLLQEEIPVKRSLSLYRNWLRK